VAVCGKVMVDGIMDPKALEENINDFYSMRVVLLFVVFQAIFVLEGSLCSVLLGYLIGLHVFLHFKGMTTYEFIMVNRNRTRVLPNDRRCDTNSALNNNASFQLRENKSVSRSDIGLRD